MPMKKTKRILVLLALCGWSFSASGIYSQNVQVKATPVTVSMSDERFSLSKVSFFKRLEKISATLNISFELINNTDKDIKLKVILIAFKRIDNRDKDMRKFIKYPSWRERDLDQEINKNIYLDSFPKIDKGAVDANFKEGNVYPEFQQYIRYAENNPTIGSDITLQGINTGVATDSGSQEFYVLSEAMKSSVFGKLKVQFNRDNAFFNQFGIIIVDPEQKKVVSSELYFFDAPFVSH